MLRLVFNADLIFKAGVRKSMSPVCKQLCQRACDSRCVIVRDVLRREFRLFIVSKATFHFTKYQQNWIDSCKSQSERNSRPIYEFAPYRSRSSAYRSLQLYSSFVELIETSWKTQESVGNTRTRKKKLREQFVHR